MYELFPRCCMNCDKMKNGKCSHDYSKDLRIYFVNNPNSPCPYKSKLEKQKYKTY